MSATAASRAIRAANTVPEVNMIADGETRPRVLADATARIRTLNDLADYAARMARPVSAPVIVEPEPAPAPGPVATPEPVTAPASAIVAPEPAPDPDPEPAPEPAPDSDDDNDDDSDDDPFDGFAAPMPETARVRTARRRAAREAATGDATLPRYRATGEAVARPKRAIPPPPADTDVAECPRCHNSGTVADFFGFRKLARPDGSFRIARQSYCRKCRTAPAVAPRPGTAAKRAPKEPAPVIIPDDGVI